MLPKDTQATYDPETSFDFPVGTFITKTFLTPEHKKIETRILTRTPDGWLPLPYVWDEEEKDATLALGGASRPFDGNKYRVPNANQCEQCHVDKAPIGPTARSLNHDGFLESWRGLAGYDGNAAALARFDDTSAPLEACARAWLEMNCAHCHQPTGSASNSGLDLRASQTDPDRWGLCKRPVAAGMGSGARRFDIVPGAPDDSIIVYRIESLEPNVMMPELGRSVMHKEGVALIREWIATMPGACAD